jgi:hypothetical protein
MAGPALSGCPSLALKKNSAFMPVVSTSRCSSLRAHCIVKPSWKKRWQASESGVAKATCSKPKFVVLLIVQHDLQEEVAVLIVVVDLIMSGKISSPVSMVICSRWQWVISYGSKVCNV